MHGRLGPWQSAIGARSCGSASGGSVNAARVRLRASCLNAAAATLADDVWPDHYGEGEYVEAFERRIAALFAASAAVLMPSGTMAQQIALRIHCDRRATSTVAFHPTCHLELHEHAGYAHLHGLKAELIGDRERLIALEDLEALSAPIGALLIELPQREIGGRLPEWDDLLAQIQWARDRHVATHLDGARVWSQRPTTGAHSRRSGPCSTPSMSRCTRDSAGWPAAFSPGRMT